WAGHQDEATRLIAKPADDRRQIQLIEALDLERDHAEDAAGGAALIQQVAAEARQTFETKAEIKFPVLFKAVLLRVGEDAVAELLGLGRLQLRRGQGLQMPVDTQLRRRVGADVQVAAAQVEHLLQQIA